MSSPLDYCSFNLTMVSIVATPTSGSSTSSLSISTNHFTIPLFMKERSSPGSGVVSLGSFSLQVKRMCMFAPAYTGLVKRSSSMP